MALRTDKSVLVTNLRHELGFDDNANVGKAYDSKLLYHLNAEYERLWYDHDWPHLWGDADNSWFDLATEAGERYYDFPAGMDPLSIRNVWVKWGDVWQPVHPNISVVHYTQYDSDADIRNDPVMRWRRHTDEQIELWPVPASALTVRFEGRKAFAKLVNDDDECFLDDQLVVLHAAAKIKKTRKGESGYGAEQAKLARRHYAMLKHRTRNTKKISFLPGVPLEAQLPRVSVARVVESS